MKKSSLAIVAIFSLSFNTFAEDDHKAHGHKPGAGQVESMVKEAKSSRKKKIQMCHDCGKPEAQCTCEGEEHSKKDEHKEHDDHKH